MTNRFTLSQHGFNPEPTPAKCFACLIPPPPFLCSKSVLLFVLPIYCKLKSTTSVHIFMWVKYQPIISHVIKISFLFFHSLICLRQNLKNSLTSAKNAVMATSELAFLFLFLVPAFAHVAASFSRIEGCVPSLSQGEKQELFASWRGSYPRSRLGQHFLLSLGIRLPAVTELTLW